MNALLAVLAMAQEVYQQAVQENHEGDMTEALQNSNVLCLEVGTAG